MLNPALDLKSMLLSNAIESFKEEVKKISIQFSNSTVTIGHIPGPSNLADSLMKLYRDPVEVINSVLYRYGPSQFETLEKLAEDTVATCKNGSFKFIGLPEKCLTEAPNVTNNSCNNCGESKNLCALARTSSQVKREDEEDLEAKEIEDEDGD